MSIRVLAAKVINHVHRLASDTIALGWRAALQGERSRWGKGTLQIGIPCAGEVTVRRRDTDYETLRQIFVLKQYAVGSSSNAVETAIANRYRDILSSGQTPVIIDAGANIGLAAIWYSRLYPDAVIISIEPDPANFKMLEANTAALPNVQGFYAAVGARPGFVEVSREAGSSWASATTRSETGSVRIVTIDDVVKSIPGGAALLAKLDIEGFEDDLFSDNLAWLDDVCAVIVEPHDWLHPTKTTSRSLQRAFGERSFGLFLHGENIFYVNDRYLLCREQAGKSAAAF
jgi:FkbM family methyltransferase